LRILAECKPFLDVRQEISGEHTRGMGMRLFRSSVEKIKAKGYAVKKQL
jgi:hypothetical protein